LDIVKKALETPKPFCVIYNCHDGTLRENFSALKKATCIKLTIKQPLMPIFDFFAAWHN
jgi:hypothetical protein